MTEDQIQTLIQFQKDILAHNEHYVLASPEDRQAEQAKLFKVSGEYLTYISAEFPDVRTVDPERIESLRPAVRELFEGEIPDTLDAAVLRAMEPEVAVIAVTKHLIRQKVRWSVPDMPGLDVFALRNKQIVFG